MRFELDLVLCALMAVSSSPALASQPASHTSHIAATIPSTRPHASTTSSSTPLPSIPPNHTSMTTPRTQAVPRGTTQTHSSSTSTSSTTPPSAAPLQPEIPSELNVGDDAFKGPQPHSFLDPLLAGLVTACVVTTAVISVVLFLRFRQRARHPEFQQLQDVPMDDLMEDTPFSSFTY